VPPFAFRLYDLAELIISDGRRCFYLSADGIARINPNTKTAPVFRTRADAELTTKIYGRVPVLIDEAKGTAGKPWGMSFTTMFHMSNDSGLFHTAAQLREAGFAIQGNRGRVVPSGISRYMKRKCLVFLTIALVATPMAKSTIPVLFRDLR